MATYEAPQVTDYGTLVELTAESNMPNADTQGGVAGTAFSAS